MSKCNNCEQIDSGAIYPCRSTSGHDWTVKIEEDKFEFDVERWKLINKLRDISTKLHMLITDLEDID